MATTPLVPATTSTIDAATLESVLLHGDLSKLSPAARVSYYNRVCETLGLNPLTKPFEYLALNGKTVLYAKRDATEQLRKLHGVSITELDAREVNGVYVVTAKAQDRQQRIDVSTGAVAIGGVKGEALANALMKAETKAKRRVTLSICGLGMLDEIEVETIPRAAVQARATSVDTVTGEILEARADVTPSEPARTATDPLHVEGLCGATEIRTTGDIAYWDVALTTDFGEVLALSTRDSDLADGAVLCEGKRVHAEYKRTAKGGLMLLTMEVVK